LINENVEVRDTDLGVKRLVMSRDSCANRISDRPNRLGCHSGFASFPVNSAI